VSVRTSSSFQDGIGAVPGTIPIAWKSRDGNAWAGAPWVGSCRSCFDSSACAALVRSSNVRVPQPGMGPRPTVVQLIGIAGVRRDGRSQEATTKWCLRKAYTACNLGSLVSPAGWLFQFKAHPSNHSQPSLLPQAIILGRDWQLLRYCQYMSVPETTIAIGVTTNV
jgi:hypothetical protein